MQVKLKEPYYANLQVSLLYFVGGGGECVGETLSGVNVGILASADLFYMNKNLYNTLKGKGKAKNA